MPSFEDAKQLLASVSESASPSLQFDPQQIVQAIRGSPEVDEAGNLVPPNPVIAWIRNFFADVANSVFGLVDPTDDQLYFNSRFMLAISCAGILVGTAHLYVVSLYAKANASLISQDIRTGVDRTFLVGAGVSFFSVLLWVYLIKKGKDSFSKETLQFFAVFNFILVVTASGLSMLTTRIIDTVIHTPSVLAQYDASVVLNIQSNFGRATTTFNSMILWNGLVLLYAVVAEMIAAYIKK
jgi:hypothetical protein